MQKLESKLPIVSNDEMLLLSTFLSLNDTDDLRSKKNSDQTSIYTSQKCTDTTCVRFEYQCYITLVNEGVPHMKV